jgi:hypothetical protein
MIDYLSIYSMGLRELCNSYDSVYFHFRDDPLRLLVADNPRVPLLFSKKIELESILRELQEVI